MRYNNVTEGVFRSRPNRFVALCEIGGEETVCHVKNTGRCRELLRDGVKVWLTKSDNPDRKTKYDLIAVEKGDKTVNIDSAAPNKVAPDLIRRLIPDITFLRPETAYKNSRFDFYAETETERWFIETKGVTLERDGVAAFPDAPTLRGEKHVYELCDAMEEGYRAMILFIIQMDGIAYLTPNYDTHPQFGEALKTAREKGVVIVAAECAVTPEKMTVEDLVEVKI